MTINGKLLSIAGAIVCASILYPVTNPTATASACKDVEFIFARGSGSNLNGENATKWRTGLETELKNTSLTYDFYELGSRSYNGHSYPAYGVGFDSLRNILTTTSAIFSVAGMGSFNTSVDHGVEEAIGRVSTISASCPGTKFVFGGYSQGAIVVDRAIKRINANKIAYAATFGDPYLYLPEGYGLFDPPACRGENLSRYRIYAPNCRAHSGLLGTADPYEPKGLEGRVGLWCTKKDIFCSNSFDFSDPIGDHLSYKTEGIYAAAAKTIVKKVLKLFPSKKIASTSKPAARRDTAILIDTTGSMESAIENYKVEALRLAAETLAGGGRVALFEYRDLSDPYIPRKILDFGCTYREFKAAIEELKVDGGGDYPESALSGALHAMNSLDWRPGATKSLVILTDAPYLDPDRDGTTLHAVTSRSLEIDPVNFYILVPDEIVDEYRALADGTGGRVFSTNDSLGLSTDYLLARPEINLTLEEYQGRPGENFTFSVETDEENLTYDWDLDFDGIFETTNAESSVSKIYTTETSGFIQVRATNPDGLSSTASAKVAITNNIEQTPEILTISRNNNVVNFTTSDNTYATIIVVSGVPLGITRDTSITLDMVEDEAEISLIPITSSGLKGFAKSLALPATSIDLKAPKAGLL